MNAVKSFFGCGFDVLDLSLKQGIVIPLVVFRVCQIGEHLDVIVIRIVDVGSGHGFDADDEGNQSGTDGQAKDDDRTKV